MAHKGKIYPVAQLWRVYSGDVQTTEAQLPEVLRFRTAVWEKPGGSHLDGTIHDCERLPWAIGDVEIGYRSDPFTISTFTLEVGAVGRLEAPGFMNWRLSVLSSGVEQIPWGWEDVADHFAWFPAQTWMLFTVPPGSPTIWPHGLTEAWGKRWAEF